jgi:hypothetical protein
MAHFAKINENGFVEEVIVINDENCLGEFPESEILGQNYILNELKKDGLYLQTSYNTFGGTHMFGGNPLRKNYAGENYFYDSENDAFLPPKPYPSWILNSSSFLWEAPVPYPSDNELYDWDEENQKWFSSVIELL